MSTKFKIDTTPISNILINSRIIIPVYQRNYQWKEEHVNALIDDLIDRENDGSDHYFGVIALSKNTETIDGVDITESKIIDGQQRLTTSLILLIWLVRNIKIEDGSETKTLKKFNDSNFYFKHEMKEGSLKKNIDNLISKEYSLLSGNFKKNYETIDERLKGYSPDYILRLFKTFKNKFIIATLDYSINKSDEMLVFENLNSKGTPLQPFDLIRNYILSICDDYQKNNLKSFEKQIINLTNTKYFSIASSEPKKEKKLERFIELYTIFKGKKKLEKYANYSVYKNFKKTFKKNDYLSKSQYDMFLYEMRKYLILFLEIELKVGVGKNIWLRTLSNKDNHYFLVFLLFEKYSSFNKINEQWEINDKISSYLKVIAQHILKVMTIQGTGQSFTNMYIDIMKLFLEKNLSTNELRSMLKNGEIKGSIETPSDNEFRLALLRKPNQKWTSYAIIDILENIANNRNSSNEIIDYQQKTVEHILPQKARDSEWPIIINNDEEYKNTINLIGNLVNFNKSANSKLGNKSFNKKLKIYKTSNSPLITGKDIKVNPLTNENDFTFETIKKRTEKLSLELLEELNKN